MTKQAYTKNLEELAYNIGNAQYNITAACIKKIADKITDKSLHNNSTKLTDIANSLYEAKFSMDSAWNICKNKMDGECANHPKVVKKYKGTIDHLAAYVSDLPDNELKKFIDYLGKDILRQANADFERGREKLASHLYQASNNLLEVGYLL